MSIPREYVYLNTNMINEKSIWGLDSTTYVIFHSLLYWIDDNLKLSKSSIQKLAKEDHMKRRGWDVKKITKALFKLEKIGLFTKSSTKTWEFLRHDLVKWEE
jgi:hypothetical protein